MSNYSSGTQGRVPQTASGERRRFRAAVCRAKARRYGKVRSSFRCLVAEERMSFVHRNALSAQELAARRRNAQNSTGPRTRLGKARVRLNALKRGRRSMRFRRFLAAVQIRPQGFFRFSDSIRLPGENLSPLEGVVVRAWQDQEHAQAWAVKKAGGRDEQSEEVL